MTEDEKQEIISVLEISLRGLVEKAIREWDQELIDRAVEKALLLLPEVVGNLIVSHVAMSKLTTDFYREHPDFRINKEAVASVLELIEGKNPGMRYEDILKEAVPEIRRRIKETAGMDVTTVTKTPTRHLPELSLKTEPESPHGEI